MTPSAMSAAPARGRLRFALFGHVLRLCSHLPARLRGRMMRTHVDAAPPPFADYFRTLRLCDPSVHFGWAARPRALHEVFPHLAAVEAIDIAPAASGLDLPLRLYRNPSIAPTRALVWVHGGGFTGGGLDCAEANWVARELAAQGIAVLTTAYRKALDGVAYPAPSDDVLAAWRWAVANAPRLGVAPAHIHIGGGSAGANLAAGVTKRIRDHGGRLPASLLLVYPLLHSRLPKLAPDDEAFCKRSVKAFVDDDFVLGVSLNYVGDPAMLDDPYAFPGCGSLHGMPPVYVINAQFDSLRGSGQAFARQVDADGGQALCESEPGALHGYLMMPSSPFARSTVERMLGWLQRPPFQHSAGATPGRLPGSHTAQ